MDTSTNNNTAMALKNMSMEDETKTLHIAMFPWLAFGHIFPYLELAKLMAQKGHKISFISTPRNIDRLPKLPETLTQLITFVKLPLPSLQGLPSGAEATSDLPDLGKGPILKRAFDLLKEPIAGFLETSRPDWLLYDFAPFWLPEVSREIGVPSAMFSIFAASCLVFIGFELPDYRTTPEEFSVPPRWVPYQSNVAFRKFEANRAFNALVNEDEDEKVLFRFVKVLTGCDVVLVRSCWELEEKPLALLAHLLGKPVLPVGQLPPAPRVEDEQTDTWRSIKKWLDDQEEKSVVYVAFGSEALWNKDELAEIALGLELSNLPFFWVLRSSNSDPIQLPSGFEERTKARGYISRSWVPQVKILGHESIGVFLSHSGWSSVVEALQFSRPLVLLAFFNDQGLNLKLLEEKMIGYPVPRDENDGSFTRYGIAESLTMVVKKEEGKVYRDKAKEVSALFGSRQVQDKYVDEFLGHLKTHANKG